MEVRGLAAVVVVVVADRLTCAPLTGSLCPSLSLEATSNDVAYQPRVDVDVVAAVV
jgi:hypothetical protein